MLKKLVLLTCWCWLFCSGYAQHNQLKNLRIRANQVVYSKESVMFFPRGFIYHVHQPDSVFYFGCYSSDQEEVTNYFERPDSVYLSAVNKHIYRRAGPYVDTIALHSLAQKISLFNKHTSQEISIDTTQTDYVILYYWATSMLEKHLNRNLRFMAKYARKHPEKRIRFLAVCIDDE